MRSGDCSCVGAQGVWRGLYTNIRDWYVKQINNSIVAEEQADSFKTKVLDAISEGFFRPGIVGAGELMTFSIGTCRVTVGFLFVAMLAFFLIAGHRWDGRPGIAAAALHDAAI